MEKIKLQATKREGTGKALNKLRESGIIPAVVYGQKKEAMHLAINDRDFAKVYREAGSSALIKLAIEGDSEKNVLIHQVDFDVVKENPIHVDFLEISMKEKITTSVPLVFVGDSSAVIELGGSLMTNKNEIEIECLPGDLPHEIEVDIATLTDFEAAIHIADVNIPAGVEVKDDPEELVATVEPPRSEEELAELEEPAEAPEMPESEHGEATAEAEETKED